MFAQLKTHNHYSSVKINWLKQIPRHWKCLPNHALFKEIKDQGHLDEQLLSVTISQGVITQTELLANSSKKDSSNLDKSKYKLVHPGDIAYNKMRAWQGAIGCSRHKGIVSPAYIVQRLRYKGSPQFFHNLFRTPHFAKEVERWSYGITSDQWSLRPEHFKMIYIPIPPFKEQLLIAKFIAEADRRISRLIQSKQQLNKFLNEQIEAVITQAVMHGLNNPLPMKNSGVERLGNIPQHWEVKKLRHVTSLLVSNVDKHKYSYEQPVRLCNYVDVYKNDCITDSIDYMIATASNDEIRKFRIRINDVIITKDSEDWQDIGVPALVTHEAEDLVCGYHLAILRPKDRVAGTYLRYVLRSKGVKEQMHVAAKGVTRFGISYTGIKDITIPLPPISEQHKIVSHIDREITASTKSISLAEKEIDLLKEYRTRLVADVVTGKLDVRAAAADLPDPSITEYETTTSSDNVKGYMDEEVEQEVSE